MLPCKLLTLKNALDIRSSVRPSCDGNTLIRSPAEDRRIINNISPKYVPRQAPRGLHGHLSLYYYCTALHCVRDPLTKEQRSQICRQICSSDSQGPFCFFFLFFLCCADWSLVLSLPLFFFSLPAARIRFSYSPPSTVFAIPLHTKCRLPWGKQTATHFREKRRNYSDWRSELQGVHCGRSGSVRCGYGYTQLRNR